MTCGLVHASYSLPKWQAVKLTFFAPCVPTTVKNNVQSPENLHFPKLALVNCYVNGNWHKYRLFRFLNTFLFSESSIYIVTGIYSIFCGLQVIP